MYDSMSHKKDYNCRGFNWLFSVYDDVIHKKGYNQKAYNWAFVALILIAVCLFLLGRLDTDKGTGTVESSLTVLAIMIAVLTAKIAADTATITDDNLRLTEESLKQTKDSTELTRNSFELTQKELKRAEIEQEIRDVEKSLDYFYYPMSNYFYRQTKAGSKGVIQAENIRDRIYAESFRYLAKKITKELIEKLRDEGYTNGTEKELLNNYIKTDIGEYETKLEDLNYKLKNLKLS